MRNAHSSTSPSFSGNSQPEESGPVTVTEPPPQGAREACGDGPRNRRHPEGADVLRARVECECRSRVDGGEGEPAEHEGASGPSGPAHGRGGAAVLSCECSRHVRGLHSVGGNGAGARPCPRDSPSRSPPRPPGDGQRVGEARSARWMYGWRPGCGACPRSFRSGPVVLNSGLRPHRGPCAVGHRAELFVGRCYD